MHALQNEDDTLTLAPILVLKHMKISEISFIPLSMGLMLYPSLVLRVALDGAESTYYGFPLPWNSRSLVTSLAKDIYWLPLIIDIVFYGILGYIIWRYVSKYILSWRPALKLTALVFLWLYGLVSIWFMIVASSFGTFHQLWFPDYFKVIHFTLGFNV